MTAASLMLTPAFAQESTEQPQDQRGPAVELEPSQQGNPQRQPPGAPEGELEQAAEDEWITLSGVVQDVYENSFILDYGDGSVTVDTADETGFSNTFALEDGQRVVVSGQIDDGFFQRRTIEARWVYLREQDQYYFVEGTDEEQMRSQMSDAQLAENDEWLSVTGTVVAVDGDDLTLDIGTNHVPIDLDRLEAEEMVSVAPGERVSVYGEMDDADFWEGPEIIADSVTVLAEN